MLCIEFMPREERKCLAEYLLKIESNKSTKTLKFFGSGFCPMVKFEPSIVELGPINPYSAGDERVITMTNTSDTPLEIFSLDFDADYKTEDNILSAVDLYDPIANLFRTKIRAPGTGLAPEVLESHARVTSASSTEEVNTDKNAEENKPSLLALPPVRADPAPRDSSSHQDFICVGPPLAGISSISSYLARKLQLSVKKPDDLLVDVAFSDHPVGLLCRRLLNCQLPEEAELTKSNEMSLKFLARETKTKRKLAPMA
jgi:hypothetical protein